MVIALHTGEDIPIRPYGVGLVLHPGEVVWCQTTIRSSLDPTPGASALKAGGQSPDRPCIVTSERVFGRLSNDRLAGFRWARIVGCRVDLTAGAEYVALDVEGQPFPAIWRGPGCAPLAVAAVYQLYGSQALLEHPGLVAVRRVRKPSERSHRQSPLPELMARSPEALRGTNQ
jgi:hypothetical protein